LPTDSRVLDIVGSAIQSSNIDDPRKDSGQMRDQVYLSNEDSRHLAQAAIQAIESAGYVILRKEKVRRK
jgi:hypothetical protein